MSSVDSTDLCDEHITHSGPGAPRCEVGRRPMACADAVIRMTRERASGERAVNSVVSRVVQSAVVVSFRCVRSGAVHVVVPAGSDTRSWTWFVGLVLVEHGDPQLVVHSCRL